MPTPYLEFPIRGEKISMRVQIRQEIADVRTPFQHIRILDTEALGKILLLDGHIQLASIDERAYHEALVHIPLLSLDRPKRALVVGGGDGGVLRELVKHGSLETIDLVEIDAGVIETCSRHLPELNGGAFDDPRVHLHIADAFEFMKLVRAPYDFMVLDITDVYEGEDGALSEQLFTPEFYDDCREAMSPDGMLVTQADNHVFCPYSMEGIVRALKPHFANLGAFQALVPSFGGYSAYVWASHQAEVQKDFPHTKAARLDLAYLSETTWRLAGENLPFAKLYR